MTEQTQPFDLDLAAFRHAVTVDMKAAAEGAFKNECRILLRILDAIDDPQAHTIPGLMDDLLANMKVRLANIAAHRRRAA